MRRAWPPSWRYPQASAVAQWFTSWCFGRVFVLLPQVHEDWWGYWDLVDLLLWSGIFLKSLNNLGVVQPYRKHSGIFGNPIHDSPLCFTSLQPSTGTLFHAVGSSVKLCGFLAPYWLFTRRTIYGDVVAVEDSVPTPFLEPSFCHLWFCKASRIF